jgi:hypothetical protein
MAATASIRFAQGVLIGTAGEVLVGVVGTTVNVSNGNNAGVQSWEIDLLYTPPGSAVAVTIPLAFDNNNDTPAASFMPDVRGSYRVMLRVWALPSRAGTPDTDIRNFVIKGKRGKVLPPYQNDPPPLPTLASGLPGAKPNEMNIDGLELGWEGSTGNGMLADLIDAVDDPLGVASLSGVANTLALAHMDKWVGVSHTAGTNLTVPPDSSVAFPIACAIVIYQAGVGQVTVVAGLGVTIRTSETLLLAKQYSVGMLFKIGTNEWVLTGDLELL